MDDDFLVIAQALCGIEQQLVLLNSVLLNIAGLRQEETPEIGKTNQRKHKYHGKGKKAFHGHN